MILIHCAMPQEADIIVDKYNLKLISVLKNIKVYKNDKIYLVVSWIWKIQTSIAITYAVKLWNFDKIINIWIAWNTWKIKNSKVWDIFLPSIFWQHDIYLPFEWSHLDYAKWKIIVENRFYIDKKLDFNIFENTVCATWDQFIDNENKIKEIVKNFDADIVEMEAFAFVSVLREFDLLDKAIVIKSVSDSADKSAITEHENNLELAMENWIKVLDSFI